MNGRPVIAVLLVLVFLVAALGVGVYAYNMGVSQGLVESGKLVVPATGVAPYPYYGGPFFMRPFGFGFGFLGCLFPLLFFFLIFSLVRGFFWRGHMGWHGMNGRWENGVPRRFEEWHEKAHESQSAQKPAA